MIIIIIIIIIIISSLGSILVGVDCILWNVVFLTGLV